jgi:pimeloyl-ACP methyl ester carboxylesterase
MLRDHLAASLGTRSAETAVRIAELIGQAHRGADEVFLDRLRTHGYRLDDEGDEAVYDRPVLVLTGRRDRVTGFADPFRRLDVYPQASYVVLDEAGHYLPFEQPALFASLVQAWLERCRQPADPAEREENGLGDRLRRVRRRAFNP